MLELGYRLGLKPWEIAQLQPVDIWEMTDGWRWRFSRELEVAAMMASAIINRIPLIAEPVSLFDLAERFPQYEPTGGGFSRPPEDDDVAEGQEEPEA